MGDCTSRVARGGDQDGEGARFAAHEVAHQPGHKTCAKVFKRQRRPVEQLQDMKGR